MLKFIYKQEPYYYENVGGQAYDIEAKIKMNDDASFTDIIEAIIRLAKTAGYNPTRKNCINAIEYIFDGREEY